MTPSETQSPAKLSEEREARRIATEALRLDEVAQSITPTGVSWDGKEAPVEWGVALVRVSRAYLDAEARLAEVEEAARKLALDLGRYAQHHAGCPKRRYPTMRCRCGCDEALRDTEGGALIHDGSGAE